MTFSPTTPEFEAPEVVEALQSDWASVPASMLPYLAFPDAGLFDEPEDDEDDDVVDAECSERA